MHYEGPIYRPPSEAHSLLVQATVGCPHNKCAFCMVYKKGPRFRIRPVDEIIGDLKEARAELGSGVRTLFLPAGDTLAMPTADLVEVCANARELFPKLTRITVYASVRSMQKQGPEGLGALVRSGLTRLHVGLESGHAPTLARMKKGSDPKSQVQACGWALRAGMELNLYALLGLAGPEDSQAHARATAGVLNRISEAGPVSLRLRTLVPKLNTLLLHWLKKGRFTLCTPRQVLAEIRTLLKELDGPLSLFSDHYTNYLNLEGELPRDRGRLLEAIDKALLLPREAFREDFVGTQ